MTLRRTIFACFLAVGLASAAQHAHGAIVRLHSSATVENSLIHLGDVADIFDDNEQATAFLQTITLDTAPIPGNSTRLNLDQIRARLLKLNVEVGSLEFQGSSVVLVTRKGQLPAPAGSAPRTTLAKPTIRESAPPARPLRKTEVVEQASSSAVPRTISSFQNVPTTDIRLAEEVVHNLVRDYLTAWAPDWGTPIIRPLLTVPTVPTILSARNGNLKIVSGQALDEDIFLLAIAVPTAELTTAHLSAQAGDPSEPATRTVHVRVRVTRRPKVLAARRVIPQGQIIHEADLEWQEVDSLKNGTSDPETVVGMEARRTLREGDFIHVNAVKPPTLIARDELVKVVVRSGSIQVSRTLKARRSGILNDVIELVPTDGSDRTPLYARVTGKGQAEPLDRDSDDRDSEIRLAVSKQ